MKRIAAKSLAVLALLVVLPLLLAACGGPAESAETTQGPSAADAAVSSSVEEPSEAAAPGELTVYSGRSEDLIGPLVARFQEQTGIQTRVRYGDTAELAATILEEGRRSPAGLFLAQDAGALGALAKAGRLTALPQELLSPVDARFRSQDDLWVGLSGRARVLVYNPQLVDEAELPQSILELADARWAGKIGWAPTNGSFQAFVTGLRVSEGEQVARQWLEGVKANSPRVYEKNTAIVEAVGRGEVAMGLVNHYYLFKLLAERGDDFPAVNYFFPGEDAGNLVNIAGAGILDTAKDTAAAQEFVRFMLSEEAQEYFSHETVEYPLAAGVASDPRLKPLDEIAMPDLDLADLSGLEETLQLLQELNIL
jgi:iron(III) transport system substrate-binding protein